SNFRFRLAANGLQPFQRSAPLNAFDADPIVFDLVYGDTPPAPPMLLAFAGKHRVARFLTLPEADYPSRGDLATLARTRLTGGVRITPRCGDPPFTSRDLSGYVQKYGNG